MPIRRTSGVFPGGGTVTLQGLPGRRTIRALNGSGVQPMTVTYQSGFVKPLGPGQEELQEIRGGADAQRLQGAIVLGGTAGEAYDAEETYS